MEQQRRLPHAGDPPVARGDPTHGPTITAAIDLLDGEYQGQQIFVEDGGLPLPGFDGLKASSAAGHANSDFMQRVTETLMPVLNSIDVIRRVMPWFAQSRDAADGVLSIKNGQLFLDWDIAASEATIDAVVSVHRKLAQLTGGMPLTPLTWTIGHDLITPHPLGGCNMGASAATGVVDYKGEVFGYPGPVRGRRRHRAEGDRSQPVAHDRRARRAHRGGSGPAVVE